MSDFKQIYSFNYFSSSNALTQCINGKDESKMINLYLNLYEEGDYDHSVVGRLTSVEAPFLKTFATQTAIHWHSLLKERFSKYGIHRIWNLNTINTTYVFFLQRI